ncbi:hypothetical protein ACQU0X_26530 [Pseudovibrio ascidiaceicola]|uniref:hypothetical protein n=1 Tax=Pseudovibrio ascidiaceicola TaxID=285279 RepID=UPI003D36D714
MELQEPFSKLFDELRGCTGYAERQRLEAKFTNLTSATPDYTIPMKGDYAIGDEILFIKIDFKKVGAQSEFDGYSLMIGKIVRDGFTGKQRLRTLTLMLDGASETKRFRESTISRIGVWRKDRQDARFVHPDPEPVAVPAKVREEEAADLKPLGGEQTDYAGASRDEWVVARGISSSGRTRDYIVHLRHPRFAARVIECDPFHNPVEREQPADVTPGTTYALGKSTVLGEFDWIDEKPVAGLEDLLQNASNYLSHVTKRGQNAAAEKSRRAKAS